MPSVAQEYKVSNDRKINEQWTGNDTEGSGCGLSKVLLPYPPAETEENHENFKEDNRYHAGFWNLTCQKLKSANNFAATFFVWKMN